MKLLRLSLITATAGCIIGCSFLPHAGGTTDTGNAKIAAVVHTSNGQRAAGARVTICPADYLAGTGADSITKRLEKVTYATTDDTGYFAIDSIENGDWHIEINDNKSEAVMIAMTLDIDPDSSVVFDTTLEPYAAISGDVGSVNDSMARYLVAYGLERKVPIGYDGTFFLDSMPAGVFHFKVVADNAAWNPVDFDRVVLSPGETAMITVYDTIALISFDTSPFGADITEDVFGFPLLVRLSGNEIDFSATSAGNIAFIKSDGTPLDFEIETWDSIGQKGVLWIAIDTLFGNATSQSIVMLGNTLSSPAKSVFDTSNSFIACYHLCGNVADATGNSFHGIDSNTVDSDSGIIANARRFNGASQFFSVNGLPDREQGTISCWFTPTVTINASTAGTQGIWGKKNGDSQDYTLSLQGAEFYAGNGSAGKLISKLEDADSGYYLSSTTGIFRAGTWYFVAWTWGEGENSLYINGNLEATIPAGIALTGTATETIGRSHYDTQNIASGGPLYFGGLLDEFRIERTQRSASWIRLCYMNQMVDSKLVTIRKR